MSWLALILLSLSLGWAVFRYGGVVPADWHISLLAIGVASLIPMGPPRIPASRQILSYLLLALLAIVLFQLIPLPLGVIQWLSPARAGLLNGLTPVLGLNSHAPLSNVPAATFYRALELAGLLLTVILVREFVRREPERVWTVAIPLLLVAGLEAVLGLVQSTMTGPNGVARGTYVNHNHFAGLLEMVLPFPVMYAVAVLRRNRSRFSSPAKPAIVAGLLLALATLILVSTLFSLSRMGFLAALCALFTVGVLSLAPATARLRRAWMRWIPTASLAILLTLAFVFLPSDQLIDRFARIAALEEISGDGRNRIWENTLNLIGDYRLVGCGLGAYQSTFQKYKNVAPLYTVDYAHNDYLQLLAEIGVVGFAVGLAVVATALTYTLRGASRPLGDARYLAIACTGSLAALLLHSLADFNLYIPSNAMVAAWVMGIAAGIDLLPWRRS